MSKTYRLAIWLTAALTLLLQPFSPLIAADELAETRQLLQKSLTLYEIDQELQRLTLREQTIAVEIEHTESGIDRQNELVAAARTRAGKMMRARYMGEHDNLLLMLFSAQSFTEIMLVADFVKTVLGNEQRALENYTESKRQLIALHEQLLRTQGELAELKKRLLEQRDTLVKLQEEVDVQLAQLSDRESAEAEMKAVTAHWEQKGLPLFKLYFQALGETTRQLPELFASKDHLSVQGLSTIFQITDEQLNAFLRSKNEIFNNFAFTFHDGYIVASGVQNEVEVSITGKYVVENDPENIVRFVVDKLVYNGFTLPESTGKALESEFGLFLKPQQYLSFIVADFVLMKQGSFAVHMKVKL